MTRSATAAVRTVVAGALLATLAVAPAGAQTASFEGPYTLTLSFGASCQAQISSVSVALTVYETAVDRGSEVLGRPTRSDEVTVAGIMLMRSGASVRGPFSTKGSLTEREPITSAEGWFFMPWLVLDGTVTSGTGRALASGTAFGYLAAGQPEEDYPSSLARCTAMDFSWTLEPQ